MFFDWLLSWMFLTKSAVNDTVAPIIGIQGEFIDFPMSPGKRDVLLNSNRYPVKKHNGAENVASEITASAAIVMDRRTGKVLFAQEANTALSIASLTKLMTTLVFLEHNPGWDTLVTMEEEFKKEESMTDIEPGDTISVRDLFQLMIISSANDAALAIMKATGATQYKFVQWMNEKALALGMTQTHFAEPTGLSAKNTASAEDIARLLDAALQREEIRDALLTSNYTYETEKNRASGTETNTNLELITKFSSRTRDIQFLGGKTGHTDEAGYCMASAFANEAGDEIIVVVLGDQTRQESAKSVEYLAKKAFEDYIWE